jgi:hypothetical protein
MRLTTICISARSITQENSRVEHSHFATSAAQSQANDSSVSVKEFLSYQEEGLACGNAKE